MERIYPHTKQKYNSHKNTTGRYGVGIYLDYAATTPIDSRVAKAMQPFFGLKFGNSMSLHGFGQEAKAALEESRGEIADFIGAKTSEIVFTGSATESNNLALKGIALANKNRGNHIIISAIEHPCVAESANWLSKQGFKITKIKVDKYGMVNPADIEKSITKDTILVSVIHASNEIGTIQDIKEIGAICHACRQAGKEKGVYFHTDASQSFGKIPIDVGKMNIDFLTASSHKIYGPKGAALLYVREGTRIEAIIHGGGQEFGLRGATVNIPAIVGFAKAVEICGREMTKEGKKLALLRDYLIKQVLKNIKGSNLNGHPESRLSNNANFWFEGVEGEAIAIQLDLEGFAVSTGSACSSVKLEPSEVLLAIGLRREQAHGSLRISLGRQTTKAEIDKLLKALPVIIDRLRQISGYKK